MSILSYIATKATKERVTFYCGFTALLTLSGYILQVILGDGLQDYFSNVIGADFLAFYTGGTFYLQEQLVAVYNYSEIAEIGVFTEQFKFQQALVGGVFDAHHPFISPPYAALIFAPFAQLNYLAAYLLWMLLCLLIIVTCAYLLQREYSSLRKYSIYRLVACGFMFFPTLSWFMYGQATPLILLCYTLTFINLRKGRDFSAGLCLGMLAFKPQLAVVLALVLLAKGRWRAIFGGSITVSAWLIIGMIMNPDAMKVYLEFSPELFNFIKLEGYPTWGIHSIYGFSVLLFDNISTDLAKNVSIVLTGITSFFLIRVWWQVPWTASDKNWDLAMAVTFVLGVIISPHLFLYDLMLLLLPFAIVFNQYQSVTRKGIEQEKLVAWSSLLWLTTFFGSYLSMMQLKITEFIGLPPMALQLSTIVIFMWSYSLWQLARLDMNDRERKGVLEISSD